MLYMDIVNTVENKTRSFVSMDMRCVYTFVMCLIYTIIIVYVCMKLYSFLQFFTLSKAHIKGVVAYNKHIG